MQTNNSSDTNFMLQVHGQFGNTANVKALRKVVKSNASANNKLKNAGPIVMRLMSNSVRDTNKFQKLHKAWSAYRRRLELQRARNKAQPPQPQHKRKRNGNRAFEMLPENVVRTHIHPHLSPRNLVSLAAVSKRHAPNAQKHPRVRFTKVIHDAATRVYPVLRDYVSAAARQPGANHLPSRYVNPTRDMPITFAMKFVQGHLALGALLKGSDIEVHDILRMPTNGPTVSLRHVSLTPTDPRAPQTADVKGLVYLAGRVLNKAIDMYNSRRNLT